MKVLIVEDSALMRRVLREGFASEKDMDFVFARDGEDALEKLESVAPDVITLDINMPKMDGLTCLAHIMERRPTPVIMVSSLTAKGAAATFEALELGAIDFIAKPDGTVSVNIDDVLVELKQKIRTAAASVGRRERKQIAKASTDLTARRAQSSDRKTLVRARPSAELIMIGSSTGGPGAVQTLLEQMPRNIPVPILVAQHMPPKFTATFASRLDSACAIDVVEVERITPMEPGVAYIAQGGSDVLVSNKFNRLVAKPVPASEEFTWHPSVSRMVASALDHIDSEHLIGVMLSGMGDDGSDEMTRIHEGGGVTIAESRESAPVFGMPGQLIEKNGATAILNADEIGGQVLTWLGCNAVMGRSSCL